MTASAMPALNELYQKFGKRVEFVIVNVREAHPGEFHPQPETAEEKQDHARALARVNGAFEEVRDRYSCGIVPEGVSCLFERPASHGTKFEDRHALMGP
jgi:non-canonical (house-cleaning) NTP pyrophosphatase